MSFQQALDRLRTIASLLPEDDPDKLEMLSIEGDYADLMEWALVKRNEHIAQAQAADSLVELYSARSGSFAKRADSMKNVVKIIMDSAGERSYKGIAATVSIRDVAPKPIISDESLIPDRFFKTEMSLMKTEINNAVKGGETIPGVTMDNGGETITIRSK